MDLLLVNGKLMVVDYINKKEFIINKGYGIFIQEFLKTEGSIYDSIALKLGAYSLMKNSISHNYELFCKNTTYVNYRNASAVEKLESLASQRESIYPEVTANEEGDVYFLNPILYKGKLSFLDKIGAILYFSCGIKCSALFKNTPHIKKYIPSNGARYPFLPVMYMYNSSLLKSGIYQYNTRSHSIKYVDQIPEHKNKNITEANICISFEAIVNRVMTRYPNSAAYQDLLFDLGHLLAMLNACIYYYKLQHLTEIKLFTYNSYELTKPIFLELYIKINDKVSRDSGLS